MQESQSATVVLADDHAIVREGIAALCAGNGFQILGQCSDGGEAVEMILANKPEFAILDLHMPGTTGVEAIRKLRAAGARTKLIILSISREEAMVMEALRAGADAYLLKDGYTSRRCSAEPDSSRRRIRRRPWMIRSPSSARAKRRSFHTSSTDCVLRISPICSISAPKPSTPIAPA